MWLACFGYGLRALLWFLSEGSNDIRAWSRFAELVTEVGLGQTYVQHDQFNHPPMMGYWAALARWLSGFGVLAFSHVFKLLPLVAEFVTGCLVMAAWRDRGERRIGYQAFTAYALSLCSILISGYHGNTDAVYFCMSFLAAYWLHRRWPLRAGAALAVAINVKLIPVLLVVPLASLCRDRRELSRYGAGLATAAIPFAVAWLGFSDVERSHMLRNLFEYRSVRDLWGIELLTRTMALATSHSLPEVSRWIRGVGNWYAFHGGKVLLLLSVAFGVWHARWGRRCFDAYVVCVLAFALFLLLGSGFAVQYVGCIVAPLLACSVLAGVVAATASGVHILFVYVLYVVSWAPIYSQHHLSPDGYAGLATWSWWALAGAVGFVVWKRCATRSPHSAGIR